MLHEFRNFTENKSAAQSTSQGKMSEHAVSKARVIVVAVGYYPWINPLIVLQLNLESERKY